MPPAVPRKTGKKKERRRPSGMARRDLEALGEMLQRGVEIVREWSTGSARREHPIFPTIGKGDPHALLCEPLPRRGQPARKILSDIEHKLLPYLRDSGHPAFMGYVQSPPSAAGVVGDLIASALDQNLTAWRSAPGAVDLERTVLDWLASIVGYGKGAGGLLTSGGSMATFTALAVARTSAAPRETVRGGLGRLGDRMMTVYTSDQIHMSVPKAVEILGLGTAATRIVATDNRFRLDPTALERAIQADRKQGHIPFCIVATCGTVNTGAVDPLPRIARVAKKHRLWLHVDGAYGGALKLAPRYRALLTGLEEADSVTLDPHKWLSAPMDAGCVLFRDGTAPLATFSTRGDYATVLPEDDPRRMFAFFDHGLELTRRFRGLKVWMILKYHGADRIGRRIEEDVEHARHLGNLIQNHDETELLAPVETGIVCFRYLPVRLRLDHGTGGEEALDAASDALNLDLLQRLQRDGKAYLSSTRLGGRFALRGCVLNFRTTRADVERVFAEVLRHGRELDAESDGARRGKGAT